MKEKFRRPMPYCINNRFCNEIRERQEGFVLQTLYMLVRSIGYRVGDSFKDIAEWVSQDEPVERSSELAVTWIGHSAFLIQIGNINILVDPLFSHVSPLFHRILPPGIPLHKLPPIDIILLSHNHRDHMEQESLLKLKQCNGLHVVVPLGNKDWFDYYGFPKVSELTWWDQYHIAGTDKNKNMRLTFLPARHWSQRGLRDKNRSLWGSWMIECNGQTIYFAGDTAYGNHFDMIVQEFPSIDVALLPIAPCEPRGLMKHSHMNSQEAGQAFLDLNANHFIPMHWGTFHFGTESFDLPIKRLKEWWNINIDKLSSQNLHLPKVGQRICFSISLKKQYKHKMKQIVHP